MEYKKKNRRGVKNGRIEVIKNVFEKHNKTEYTSAQLATILDQNFARKESLGGISQELMRLTRQGFLTRRPSGIVLNSGSNIYLYKKR